MRFLLFCLLVIAFFSQSCRLDSDGRVNSSTLPIKTDAENSVRLCTDKIDNDNDGLIDCDDSECRELGTDETPGPGRIVCPWEYDKEKGTRKFLENTDYTCSDGIDNDSNRFVDCEDHSCSQNPNVSVCKCTPTVGEGEETGDELCTDGIDNDCNGHMDCKDFSCCKLRDDKCTDACFKILCPNGKDERAVKCLSKDDSPRERDDCKRNDADYWEKICSDGIDNDCNGYTDCKDFGCCGKHEKSFCAKVCQSGSFERAPEDSESLCQDGHDNDLDGYIDCNDPGCKSTTYCKDAGDEPKVRPNDFRFLSIAERNAIRAEEKLLCGDDKDNDKNGLKDCDDPKCVALAAERVTAEELPFRVKCQEIESKE